MQHLTRQESIPVALYTGEKIMDDFTAVGEAYHMKKVFHNKSLKFIQCYVVRQESQNC